MSHRHTTISVSDAWGYQGPVAIPPYTEQNRAAHGNVGYTERCACGYERDTLVNGRHEELGPWRESPEMREARERRAEAHRLQGERYAQAWRLLRRARETLPIGRLVDLAPDLALDLHVDGRTLTAGDLLSDETRLDVVVAGRRSRCSIGSLRQAAREWSDAPGTPAHNVYTAIAAVLPAAQEACRG